MYTVLTRVTKVKKKKRKRKKNISRVHRVATESVENHVQNISTTKKIITWEHGHSDAFSLLLCSHMIGNMICHCCIWLSLFLPRLTFSEGKPGLDLQLCAYNEDKGDRREDFASTF